MNRFAITMAAAVLATTLLSRAQVVRDPFLDLSAPKSVATPEQPPETAVKPEPHSMQRTPVRLIQENTPKVSVKGILTSTLQPRAILAGPASTFLVKEGDKLGDYRVIHIDRGGVTFAFKKIKFRRLLDNPQ